MGGSYGFYINTVNASTVVLTPLTSVDAGASLGASLREQAAARMHKFAFAAHAYNNCIIIDSAKAPQIVSQP